MANFPLKMLVSFLQRRSLRTNAAPLLKPSSKLPKKPPKINETEEKLLPVWGKGESVIALLKTQHFSETQIARLVERWPQIVNARVSSNLEPKFRFLNEAGLSGTFLPCIILSNPLILRRSLNAHLVPSIDFLKAHLGKDNDVALHMVIKRASWILTSDLEKVLRPNIAFLEKEGVPMSSILKLLTSQPRSLLRSMDRLRYGVETAKKFGFKPHEPMFVHALRVMLSMDESGLQRKLEVLKSLGWSDADLKSAVMREPLCLTCSVEKLKGNTDFVVNTIKAEPESIIANPKLLMYSLKKRIVPRYNVWKLLQEKRLVQRNMIASFLNIPDRDFVRRYIRKYIDRVPHLLDVYNGNSKLDAVSVEQ